MARGYAVSAQLVTGREARRWVYYAPFALGYDSWMIGILLGRPGYSWAQLGSRARDNGSIDLSCARGRGTMLVQAIVRVR